jgi:hypothetical protein
LRPCAELAWWCPAKAAGKLVKRVTANGADILAVARALEIPITPHDIVLLRAGAAVARIESALRQAQANGGLSFFNAEYKRRRLEARAQGRRFMRYDEAMARLRKVLAGAATNGGVTKAIVEQVFQNRGPRLEGTALTGGRD